MLLDAFLLYRLFGSAAFPATSAWPMGVASAEAIKAGDRGGRQAWLLLGGVATGAAGTVAGIPMSALGVALIGGAAAMTAFGIGLLARGYSMSVFGFDIGAIYVPHGMMIGAGLVALLQVTLAVVGRRQSGKHGDAGGIADAAHADTQRGKPEGAARILRLGGLGYLGIMVFLTLATGVYTGMSPLMLAGFVVFGTFSAFMHELIVGIAAMHSGWFPAFAVALISLLIGIMIGFPPEALVVLAGFSAATGPAFADMGYDLKAGYLLRGERALDAFELEGRRQQWIASLIGFLTAIVVVVAVHRLLLDGGLNAPINATYVAAIEAGISGDVARQLVLWAIPGAVLQILGGSRRQLGVLLATGLLISNPAAGWMVVVGLALRLAIRQRYGDGLKKELEVFAGGVIAGDALCGFAMGAGRSLVK
jgi:uncharacterized oligopeptide transporter (OPT) family protein